MASDIADRKTLISSCHRESAHSLASWLELDLSASLSPQQSSNSQISLQFSQLQVCRLLDPGMPLQCGQSHMYQKKSGKENVCCAVEESLDIEAVVCSLAGKLFMGGTSFTLLQIISHPL